MKEDRLDTLDAYFGVGKSLIVTKYFWDEGLSYLQMRRLILPHYIPYTNGTLEHIILAKNIGTKFRSICCNQFQVCSIKLYLYQFKTNQDYNTIAGVAYNIISVEEKRINQRKPLLFFRLMVSSMSTQLHISSFCFFHRSIHSELLLQFLDEFRYWYRLRFSVVNASLSSNSSLLVIKIRCNIQLFMPLQMKPSFFSILTKLWKCAFCQIMCV